MGASAYTLHDKCCLIISGQAKKVRNCFLYFEIRFHTPRDFGCMAKKNEPYIPQISKSMSYVALF